MPVRSTICTLRDFVVEEILVVPVPKRLVIRNHTLGILLRTAQVAIFLGLVIACVVNKVWRTSVSPAPWIVEFWLEEPADAEERMRLHNSKVRHCYNPRSYWESGDAAVGPGRNAFRPHGCEAVTSFEASWRDTGRLFVPTLVQEMEVFGGEFCANNLTQTLELPPGASVKEHCTDTHDPNTRSCSCTVDRTFLVQNPEQQRVVLRHGYITDLSQGEGRHVRQESIMSPVRRTKVFGEPVQEEQGELRTIILATDGSPCKVGGRSEWLPSQARWGISGTLGEWLICAGVELDAAPELLLPGAPGLASHFRTMGLVVQMRLDYYNTDHGFFPTHADAGVCVLTLQAQVQWTTVPTVHDRLLLPQQAGGLLRAERVRMQYGVMLTTTVGGQHTTFDLRKLISAVVELIVLFRLPLMFVRFLSLYCLGFMSEVYRRARATQFSIYSHFHGAIARMMLAEIGFRGLLGGVWKGKAATKDLLTLRQVTSHVQDLFQEQMKFRILKSEDVDRIAAVAFKHMCKTSPDAESGAGGGVSCHDYVQSCTADDTMDITMITKVLLRETAGASSCIGRFFDTNRRRLDTSLRGGEHLGSDDAIVGVSTGTSHPSTFGAIESESSKAPSVNQFTQEHPQHAQPTPTTSLASLESSADAATQVTHGTSLKARREEEEEEEEIDKVDDGNGHLRKLEFEPTVRDLEANIACLQQDSKADVASLREDMEAKHNKVMEEVEKLRCIVKTALEVSAWQIHSLEERLKRLDSLTRNHTCIDCGLVDEAGMKVVNVNAAAAASAAATRKQAGQGRSGNDGINAVRRKSPRAFRRLTARFPLPRRSYSASPRFCKGQMSPRQRPQRSISPGNRPVARCPAANPPKLRGRREAAGAAVATEVVALCPSSTETQALCPSSTQTQEGRFACFAPREQIPEAVSAQWVPATLLQQQLHQQVQPQMRTPQLRSHHLHQLQEKQLAHEQIQGPKDCCESAETPQSMNRSILSMPLSDLVQISADPESREVLESLSGLRCSPGKEDTPRVDEQEHMAAGPSFRDLQQATEIDEGAPHGSAATAAARGTSSDGVCEYDRYRDRYVKAWAAV